MCVCLVGKARLGIRHLQLVALGLSRAAYRLDLFYFDTVRLNI